MHVNHSDRGHAEFSPSSLKYIAGCSGYEGRSGTSAAAEMGTRIHEAIEVLDPSSLESDEEVAIYSEIVKDQSDYLSSYSSVHWSTDQYAEIVLDIELEGTSTFGTCDSLHIYGETVGVLADYKTGISKIDPPKDNWQAKAYTVGCFQKFPKLEEIDFVFFIPQRNEILSHKFRRADMGHLITELSNVIKKAEKARPYWEEGTPPVKYLKPTPDCRFCKHEDVCPALGGLVIKVAKKVNPELPDVDFDSTEDPEVLEQLWVIAKTVSNWADRLKKRTVELAREGLEFPTLKLKSMGSTRKIKDNESFMKIAKTYGLTQKDILQNVNIPLAKIAKVVGATADKGEKQNLSQEFIADCEADGIIENSAPRHTLS